MTRVCQASHCFPWRRLLWHAAAIFVLAAAMPAAAVDELDYGLEEHRLSRVKIAGNEAFSDTELKQVLRLEEPDWRHPLRATNYRPDLIESRLRLVRNHYRQLGYHDASAGLDSIGVSAADGDILYISIVEGPFTEIGSLAFVGIGAVEEGDLRAVLTLIEGRPAPADLNGFGEDIYRMRGVYQDRAYLQVEIEPAMTIRATDDPLRYRAEVTYTITPGSAYTVSRIDIAGNQTTDTELVTRELALRPGDPFARGNVELTRQRLLATALFRDVSLTSTERDSTLATAVLDIRVTERRPAFWEFGFGLGSRERVRSLIGWGHNNLWGSGQRLQVRLRGYWNVEEILGVRRAFNEGDLNFRGDVLYRSPHLLGNRYPLEVNLFARRETRGESGLIQNVQGLIVGTTRADGRQLTNRLDLSLRRVNPEVHPAAPDSLQELFDTHNITRSETRSLLHSLFHDSRDNPFNPQRGHYLTFQDEIAGGLLGGDNSFAKASTGYHHYLRLLGGVLATRVRVGAVWPYGQSVREGANGVPYDDRFFAGGAFTVRGYRDNSLGPPISQASELEEIGFGSDTPLPANPARGGNYQLITNVEWRFPLPLVSHLVGSVVFIDGGNVWERYEDIRLRGFRLTSRPGDPNDPSSTKIWDYRYSIGTGLRLETPFGPVRLDVGWPLKRARNPTVNQPVEDDNWRAHFSLGQPF